MRWSVKRAHRVNASIFVAFIVLHLGTHLAAWFGIGAHGVALDAARRLYRPLVVEAALITLFAAQVVLGFVLLARRVRSGRRNGAWGGGWGIAQLLSGAYLAYFIVAHVGAALAARNLSGIDTNFYWPAGTLTLDPLRWGFAPYYALALTALGVHLAAALRFRGATRWPRRIAMAGPVLAIAILPPFAGLAYSIDLPPEYRDYFSGYAW